MRPRGGDHLKPAQAGGIEEVAEQIATAALRRHITVEGLDDQRLKLRAGAVVPAADQVAPVQGLRQAKGLGAPALKLGSCQAAAGAPGLARVVLSQAGVGGKAPEAGDRVALNVRLADIAIAEQLDRRSQIAW